MSPCEGCEYLEACKKAPDDCTRNSEFQTLVAELEERRQDLRRAVQ